METQKNYEMTVVRPKTDALVEVEQQRAIAETQSAMIIAKKFSRNQIEALDRIKNACSRPALAESALYQYSRGGTDITGPSIRLAEAIAQNWGNMQFGIRELEQRDGWSTIEAYAWDLETNVREVKQFQVKHERSTKRGRYALEDSRDIYELTANQGARRLRACILGIIPGDVVEEAITQCETTMRTRVEVTKEKITSLVEKFGEYKVTQKQIEKRIQRRIDAITPALMLNLGKIYNSLKDGMSVPADWFEPDENSTPDESKAGAEGFKSKLKKEKQNEGGNKEPDPLYAIQAKINEANESFPGAKKQAMKELKIDQILTVEAGEKVLKKINELVDSGKF